MTDTKQPEALILAVCLDETDYTTRPQMRRAAAELRRQHARITELEAENQILEEMNQQLREQNEAVGNACASLEAENRALKGEMEAIGAGGVTGLRADHVRDAAQKVRFERAKGSTALAMLENLSDALWHCGDAVLVWANEGDLHMFGTAIAQEGGK